MDDIVNRCRQMLFGWGFVGLIYSLGAAWPGVPHVLAETSLDRLVPFSAVGIWVYLSFFVLVAGTFMTLPAERLPRFTRSFQIAAVISGVAFVVWPTQLVYPAVDGYGASATVLRFLAQHDSGRNCLPSLHAALTLLCVLAHLEARRPVRSVVFAAWGLAMLYSILQTRRHLSLDIAAGLAVAIVSCALSRWERAGVRANAKAPGLPLRRRLTPPSAQRGERSIRSQSTKVAS